MARKRVPIFPIFEEVRRVTASLTNEQFGQAMRYALGCYYGDPEQEEPDALTKLAATVLLEQAARYDVFREQQRNNARNSKSDGTPSAAKCSQKQPIQAENTQGQSSAPPSPSPIPSPVNDICASAIRLLNELTGSAYRSASKSTQRLISARVKDGYSLDDIETVIRHQCSLWAKDEKMQKYLRPETLFGSKFEGYLNDARRHAPKQKQKLGLAPLEDPYEAAMREGYHD